MTRGTILLTSLEKQVERILKELGIEYISQYPTHSGFIIDFVIPGKMIAIEVDGDAWHNSKKAKKKDRFKDYQLEREGWKVIRIKEKNVNRNYLINKLMNLKNKNNGNT